MFLFTTTVGASGHRLSYGRLHTVQWIAPGFHLTSSVASWSTNRGNTRLTKSTLHHIRTTRIYPSRCMIYSQMIYGNSWVNILYLRMPQYHLNLLLWINSSHDRESARMTLNLHVAPVHLHYNSNSSRMLFGAVYDYTVYIWVFWPVV